ncbi:MAG TPA: adenylate/guanylate cyclase domain-containing protein [Casimicrobiaceae bacterium]|jgi:adenylate cyclase
MRVALKFPWRGKFALLMQRPTLPERVATRVRVQEERSEILVGWIQMAVVSGFFLVYLASPKTFSADAPFRPVPWVLAAYIAFTLLRLFLAHRHRLPEWLRYLSIVIDMALLLGLIWSFHLQYQQPPSFYLKAPTLLYVFIFIALRTLNFDARKVLTAGAVAVVGWVLLVAYVVIADPHERVVTRDYVTYMTSNRLLIGAEVDKVIAILVVTAVLGFAIMRNRRLLTFAVTESETNQDLARFVPEEVAALIKKSDQGVKLGVGEPREVTMLFIDLESFTSLSERLAPELLVHTLNEFYALVAGPVVRHEGAIDQFQGDAILATFNAPRLTKDHAANAILAAVEIQALLKARTFGDGITLRARIGINTGVVIHGLIGTPDRMGYTVIGDEVNVASRLEGLNKQYGTTIIVSEQTRDLAGSERFVFDLLDEALIRGRTTPTRIYRLGEA